MKFVPVPLLLALAVGAARAEVGIEYIGHASFVVTSPAGVRVALDPFNGKRWLGYGFPDDVAADVVLVSHPHYDHDATYYWPDTVPKLRRAGTYAVGDVRLVGLAGRHADPYGKDFGQTNTIWIVETGGLRIAHLGDNGPLDEETTRRLVRVDVLMIPVDGEEHILPFDAVDAIRAALAPAVTIPMHYRLEGFLDRPRSLGPVEPWLERERNGRVERLSSNRLRLAPPAGPPRIVVFRPSERLRPWPAALAEGWERLERAEALVRERPGAVAEAANLVREAAERADAIVFAFHWARLLAEGSPDEAVAVLETALARAARDDWEYRFRARLLLGELYARRGAAEAAAEQFRIVLAGTHRAELRDKARSFLAELPSGGAAR